MRLVLAKYMRSNWVGRYMLSLFTCCRHYPCAATRDTLRSFPQPYQLSPKGSSGRPAQRPSVTAMESEGNQGIRRLPHPENGVALLRPDSGVQRSRCILSAGLRSTTCCVGSSGSIRRSNRQDQLIMIPLVLYLPVQVTDDQSGSVR